MINQSVFAFANVEDYLAPSEILLRDKDNPTAFFARAKLTDADGHPTPVAQRALRTLGIVSRIRSSALTATPAAYQSPPPSPLDNQYFSAAPFLFGPDRAMKFSAQPLAPVTAETLDVSDPRYLRTALHQRLTRLARARWSSPFRCRCGRERNSRTKSTRTSRTPPSNGCGAASLH